MCRQVTMVAKFLDGNDDGDSNENDKKNKPIGLY